jgi:hypothetical protein
LDHGGQRFFFITIAFQVGLSEYQMKFFFLPEFGFSINMHFPHAPSSAVPQQLSFVPSSVESESEAAPTNQIFSP